MAANAYFLAGTRKALSLLRSPEQHPSENACEVGKDHWADRLLFRIPRTRIVLFKPVPVPVRITDPLSSLPISRNSIRYQDGLASHWGDAWTVLWFGMCAYWLRNGLVDLQIPALASKLGLSVPKHVCCKILITLKMPSAPAQNYMFLVRRYL